MATWVQITNLMHQHYAVQKESEDSISVRIRLDSGRTQQVSILLEEQIPGYPFVGLFSPFTYLNTDQVDTTEVTKALSRRTKTAGLTIQGGVLGYVWSWPLANIDPTDFHVVLQLLINDADAQEQASHDADLF